MHTTLEPSDAAVKNKDEPLLLDDFFHGREYPLAEPHYRMLRDVAEAVRTGPDYLSVWTWREQAIALYAPDLDAGYESLAEHFGLSEAELRECFHPYAVEIASPICRGRVTREDVAARLVEFVVERDAAEGRRRNGDLEGRCGDGEHDTNGRA